MNNKTILWLILVLIAFGLGFQIGSSGVKVNNENSAAEVKSPDIVPESVTLPINWGNAGKNMVDFGVIDMEKFSKLYESRGRLSNEVSNFLNEGGHKEIVMTKNNSRELLNVFWAFGLANKSDILENGEMTNPKYGGAGRFASTGGWSLSKGDAMNHYSAYNLVNLSSEQELLVAKVAGNIYRPCCGNSTAFPDCNHGMAMLGFLELMVSEGAGEAEMYDTALKVNSLWFPNVYETIAGYFSEQGIDWKDVSSKEVLGVNYSSAAGYRKILQTMESTGRSGASCGV